MKDVVVIGGGASGLVAAIFAAKGGKHVTILERNNTCGKKILVTGNGRCNYWNSDMDISYYLSNDLDVLEKIITGDNKKCILDFFDILGIVPNIKNGYYYPFSNQATSVKNALLIEANLLGVEIITDFKVTEIVKNENFIINPSKEHIQAKNVILSTGSKAASYTGSDGIGYVLAKSLSHSVIKPLPSLVQLKGNEKYFKKWAGVRSLVNVSLYEDGKKIKEEYGEIQLTDYGISGVCVFNISGYVATGLSQGKNECVVIDFMPWLEDDLNKWLKKQGSKVKGRTVSELLEGFLNYKLVKVILEKSNICLSMLFDNLNEKQIENLSNNLKQFNLNIVGTNSFDKAQICSGGVPLKEINPETMESLKISGLYFTGEILDVAGACGGYNLGFAWISGMLAGKGVSND